VDQPVAFPKKISTDLTPAPTAPNATTTRDRRVKKKKCLAHHFKDPPGAATMIDVKLSGLPTMPDKNSSHF
jgi:hypothetical protein